MSAGDGMDVPERIAMCAYRDGMHEHVPLKADEPVPARCFAGYCDCTPVEYVRADPQRRAVALLEQILEMEPGPYGFGGNDAVEMQALAQWACDLLQGGRQ